MGRRSNGANARKVLNCIQVNDGQILANDIANQTGMHPQAVSRLLASMEDTTGVLLQEDNHGRLGIFGRRRR